MAPEQRLKPYRGFIHTELRSGDQVWVKVSRQMITAAILGKEPAEQTRSYISVVLGSPVQNDEPHKKAFHRPEQICWEASEP